VGGIHAALQDQILGQGPHLVARQGGDDRGPHAEGFAQAAGDIVFAAALPDLEAAGCPDPALTRVEAQHDLAQGDAIPAAVFGRSNGQQVCHFISEGSHSESAEGYSSTGGGTLVTGENEYMDTLPSMNLSLEPVEDLILRFGVAKVMARPQIGNTLAGTNYLVPTTSLAATGPNFTAAIGNVKLEPFRATTYDLSVEWYFAPESLLSFAYFYKDIDTYIQILRQDLPYASLTTLNPSAFDPAFCTGVCTASTVFQLTAAVNTEGGPLKGFEVSYQQPFRFLPGPLSNLGVQLNYTHVESEIDYCANALCTVFQTADLVNLSPASWNATLYYEDDAFSARVSAASRDGYIQNVPGRNGNSIEGKKETLNIDASAAWQISEQVEVTFEALNLTDEENHQFVGDGLDRESTSVFHHTGRQYFVGARYRF
jgi:TonB-dependent receptor